MKNQPFDSALISIFRLFTAIRLGVTLLGVGALMARAHGTLDRFDTGTWITLAETCLLLIYLSWGALQTRLGRWYLPAALTLTTLGPIAASFPWMAFAPPVAIPAPTEVLQARSLMSQWQLVIVLLMPLILVSWRYGFFYALGYTLAIDFVDVALITLTNGSILEIHPLILLSILAFRTLFYLLIGYTINRLAQELRAQNTRLEQANRQLARNAISMEQLAVSRERNRMARELHDTLAHTMSGMAVQLEAVETIWESDPDQARRLIKDALSQTRGGLKEARRAIQALRAAPLEDMGLLLALEHLARAETERGGQALMLGLPDQLPGLSHEAEHTLYRVAEEALRNAVHHAGASQISLRLEVEAQRLTMLVQDDGAGFDPAGPAPQDRFGLQGMQERAEAIDAQLSIKSLPGQGTTVKLEVNAW